MAKYIIEIEDEPVNGLYKAKAFNTLVFDAEGLKKLRPYKDDKTYYYIKEDLTVGSSPFVESDEDLMRREVGNYFLTYEAAKQAIRRIFNLDDWT